MTDNDSKTIKPVENLHYIAGLSPAQRHEQRKQKKGSKKQGEEEAEQELNNSANEKTDDNQNLNDTGVDYCA